MKSIVKPSSPTAPKRNSIWSISEVGNMNEVAFHGVNVMLTDGINPDKVCVGDNPTWERLQTVVDELIDITGDRHHVFIEDFCEENGMLVVCLGS